MARYPCTSTAITLKQARTIEAASDHAARLDYLLLRKKVVKL
jgi:hypothetical protein